MPPLVLTPNHCGGHVSHRSHRACRYDFLIDADFHPWLLEINCSPTMEHSTPVTKELVRQLSEDVVKVTVDVPTHRARPRVPPAAADAAAPPTAISVAAPSGGAAAVDVPRAESAQNRDEEFLFGRSGGNATLAFRQTFAGVDTGQFVCSFRDAPVAGGARRSLLAADDLSVVGAPLKLPPPLAPRAPRPRPWQLHTAARERSASPDVAAPSAKPETPPHVVTSPACSLANERAGSDAELSEASPTRTSVTCADLCGEEAAVLQHSSSMGESRASAPVLTSARRRNSDAAFQSTVVAMVADGELKRLSASLRADARCSDGTQPDPGAVAAVATPPDAAMASRLRGVAPARATAAVRRRQPQQGGVVPSVCSLTMPVVASPAAARGAHDAAQPRGGKRVLAQGAGSGVPPCIAAGLQGGQAPSARLAGGGGSAAPGSPTKRDSFGAGAHSARIKSATRARLVRRLQSACMGPQQERQAAVQHMQQALLGRILEQVDALAPPATPRDASRTSVSMPECGGCADELAGMPPAADAGIACVASHCDAAQNLAAGPGLCVSKAPQIGPRHMAEPLCSNGRQQRGTRASLQQTTTERSPSGPQATAVGASSDAKAAHLALVTLDCNDLPPDVPAATQRGPRALGAVKRACAPALDGAHGGQALRTQQMRALAGLSRAQSMPAPHEHKRLPPAPACVNLDRGSSPFVREMQRRYEARGSALVAQHSMPRMRSEHAAAADLALHAGRSLKRDARSGHAEAEAWEVRLV